MKPIIILLLSLLPFGAFAGEPAPASAAGEPTVAELSAQLEALKARTSTWDKIAARLPRISGYVQTGYEWSETSSTFFIKRVRLNLAGDIAEKLDYRVQIEFCGPKIVDAYIRYRPFEQLNFQLGEYKLPFSIENTDYVPLKYEFIEYPLSLRRLMGFNDVCGLSATGRDMGAMLYGGFFNRKGYSVLGYNFGVFNGEGLNVKDKNKSKDLVARLTLRPVRGLQIAGSYYWGEYGSDYLKRVRYGAGACYDAFAVDVYYGMRPVKNGFYMRYGLRLQLPVGMKLRMGASPNLAGLIEGTDTDVALDTWYDVDKELRKSIVPAVNLTYGYTFGHADIGLQWAMAFASPHQEMGKSPWSLSLDFAYRF